MKLDVEGIRRQDPGTMSEFYNLCRKSARIGAGRVGALEYADDITQEMVMWVMNSFLSRYDPANDVDAFLIRVGENMGRTHSRRGRREIQTGAPGLDENSAFDNLQDESIADAALVEQEQLEKRSMEAKQILFTRIRHRRAERENQRERDRARTKSDQPVSQGDVVPFRAVGETAQVKDKLGLTYKQISERVNQPIGVVRATLQGQGESNAEVLQVVKELEEKAPVDATIPVWKRMRHWCDLLGISQQQQHWHVALGDMIGVHRATMYRWRHGKTQPLPHTMRALDVYIAELASAQKKQEA